MNQKQIRNCIRGDSSLPVARFRNDSRINKEKSVSELTPNYRPKWHNLPFSHFARSEKRKPQPLLPHMHNSCLSAYCENAYSLPARNYIQLILWIFIYEFFIWRQPFVWFWLPVQTWGGGKQTPFSCNLCLSWAKGKGIVCMRNPHRLENASLGTTFVVYDTSESCNSLAVCARWNIISIRVCAVVLNRNEFFEFENKFRSFNYATTIDIEGHMSIDAIEHWSVILSDFYSYNLRADSSSPTEMWKVSSLRRASTHRLTATAVAHIV